MGTSNSARKELVLKAILSKLTPERRQELERYLPEEKRLALDNLPSPLLPPNFDEINLSSILEKVHWSWFLPTLKSYSVMEQKLFVSSLNPYAGKNLARTLTLSLNGRDLTEVARSYLRKLLLDSLLGPEMSILPISCLPASSLDPLLYVTKKELTELIDHLSIQDLAVELRQIVETKMLKKIYIFLTDEEKKLLKLASGTKDSFTLGKLGLDRWDGSEESLRLLLHRRGLQRLGVGLSGQHPDFIWYICHQLDIGRGTALNKACTKEPIPNITPVVFKQIEELL
ncbi:MAG: hypothetical protein A3D96_05665 [Chlamydiae bacterium RIFCSPHIGHO2_12_FULL_44_59]|nr:MAG: hypothetical protein A2796_03495 [Chlamydiae bacterium RIFCSPHIGHO2_01_FULL_44_39]OGN61119.1 MAG: hypothetical protein A3D96_05665 [Chlamydiae bacterium RIFCSPHIGHO2_12_FULL_44_59]OGN65589.1 MAG: hypothetical protein A2978_06470 [Chlamydiae bacterium RIFCSPLOWO2_01_FULL_44_52]OGN68066.1 MAG: hypothetical protein A3I67_05140 [Chlamydiae bacterium RIFCSPLOWO2_02_FULL_45_22]OGN68955.1 MAG: hypothetical protein A3F79_01765 [Chlamydiae bacterium RIFCSPLOWO2_12_FULL_45_20]